MNRLVIVGNGFDLAHGFKTSYNDFLLDYLKECFRDSQKHPNYKHEDNLIRIDCNSHRNNFYESVNSIKSLLENPNVKVSGNPIMLNTGYNSLTHPFILSFNSDFFYKLLYSQNWTDIESAYFEHLIFLTVGPNGYEKDLLHDFHIEFDYLSEKIYAYMSKIEDKINELDSFPKYHIMHKCYDFINEDDFKHFFKGIAIRRNLVSNVMFLNFNYTNLISKYIAMYNDEDNTPTRLINIHGSIKYKENLIFGYGDDTHPKYKEIELINDNNVLSKMKSFKYPTSQNYNQGLIDFIESGLFDVIVVGHSLGISDRVLLKTIFENANCKMITLLHREGKENDPMKWIPLSRHFDNKELMRRKIKPFTEDDIL